MPTGRRFSEAEVAELENLVVPFLRTATVEERIAVDLAAGRLMRARTDEEAEAAWAAMTRLLAREADGGLE